MCIVHDKCIHYIIKDISTDIYNLKMFSEATLSNWACTVSY